MPPVIVDTSKTHEFVDANSFYHWLALNHNAEREVWIKVHKLGSGLKSVTSVQAIDVALCWGWIDGIRKAFDSSSFLQRYTPRGRRSIWSHINVGNVTRLIAAGRMTEHGLKHVDAAKADGRWDHAYRSGKSMKIAGDLQAAIDAVPKAKNTLAELNAQNRFAFAFRTHIMKTDAGRKKKIASFVAMLERGEMIYPQRKK
jgi:uncharacterized protein YdeI (YjbR/CyaY-like superfamily)